MGVPDLERWHGAECTAGATRFGGRNRKFLWHRVKGALTKLGRFILASDLSLILALQMTIAPNQASRVRCRLIEDKDLGEVADLLSRGFPNTSRHYWMAGFARWKSLPAIEEMPRYGYVLDTGFGPVGAILMISSRRGDHVVSNLCGWYVDPQWLSHAGLLISL